MNTDLLWDLIEDCRRRADGPHERLVLLRTDLARRPVADVVRFQAGLDEVGARGHSWELWAAADRILGGWCSDDGFLDFRLWLVGCGRAAFERALAEPDSLAEVPEVRRLADRPRSDWDEDWPGWEELDYVAAEAHESLTGIRDDGDTFQDLVEDLADEEGGLSWIPGAEPAGTRWDVRDEAEAARWLPGLSGLFPLDRARAGTG